MANSTDWEITGTNLKRVREDSRKDVVGGDLDIRNGPDLFRAFESIEGTFGTFSIDEHGVWTYTLDNTREATQALTKGESASDWFYAESADGTLSSAVLVIINGSDDPSSPSEISLVGVPDISA